MSVGYQHILQCVEAGVAVWERLICENDIVGVYVTHRDLIHTHSMKLMGHLIAIAAVNTFCLVSQDPRQPAHP